MKPFLLRIFDARGNRLLKFFVGGGLTQYAHALLLSMCDQRQRDLIMFKINWSDQHAAKCFLVSDNTGRAVTTDGNPFADAVGAVRAYANSPILSFWRSVGDAAALFSSD